MHVNKCPGSTHSSRLLGCQKNFNNTSRYFYFLALTVVKHFIDLDLIKLLQTHKSRLVTGSWGVHWASFPSCVGFLRRGTGMPTKSTCQRRWSSWESSTPGGSWRFACARRSLLFFVCFSVVMVSSECDEINVEMHSHREHFRCFRGLCWLQYPVTSLTRSTETLLRNYMTSPMTPAPQVHTDLLYMWYSFIFDSLPSSYFLPLVIIFFNTASAFCERPWAACYYHRPTTCTQHSNQAAKNLLLEHIY